jgi:nucleoside-diphosphate-sugar epimerase
MSSVIAVLGATGVYGRHLLPRLAVRGARVRALVRNPEAALVARACGADVRAADIFDFDSLCRGLHGCDVAINLATALRDRGANVDYAHNDRVRRVGVPIFLRACREAGVARVVQQSVAMAHASGSEWADETTGPPAANDPVAAAAIATVVEVERMVEESELDWLVLAGGLFYGPGTEWDDRWFTKARAGTLRIPADGSDYVSLIHIADMAEATALAVERWPSRRALIVADDAPSRWGDVLRFVAEIAGGPEPKAGGRQGFPSFRVRNHRAREALGWAPFYANFRAGLAR